MTYSSYRAFSHGVSMFPLRNCPRPGRTRQDRLGPGLACTPDLQLCQVKPALHAVILSRAATVANAISTLSDRP